MDQESEPVLKGRSRFKAAAKHDCHADAGQQMCAECEGRGAADAIQRSSTTSRNPRRLHSIRNCSSVSHPVYETLPVFQTPDNNICVMTHAGITAMRSARDSAMMQTRRFMVPVTSTPIAPR